MTPHHRGWCGGRRRAVGVALALIAFAVAGIALPTSAAAIPGLPDCAEAPTPEVPGRGVVGFFESAPDPLPADADPWASEPTTSIHAQYGYSGLRWNTYDLGCGPDLARSPDAAIGTSVGNWILTLPKAAVAATGAVIGAAFEPDFLTVFDPLVAEVVDTLRRTVFEQWAFLVIAALGLLLIWRARHASLASSAAAIGWALLVMVIATLLFRWPLAAGQAADQTVTTTLGAVSGGLNGAAPQGRGGASGQATAGMHEALLYQAWLGGTFGDANSDVARRYGPAIFDAQALTWREANVLQNDPAAGRRIIDTKQQAYEDTAARIQTEDPDAYEYLTGRRSDTRVGYALLAAFATLCAIPFLLVAGLLVLGALIIVRFGVMLFPVFATLGLFPTMRGLVTGVGSTVASALINAVIFGIGAAVAVRGIGVLLAPSTGLPPWLDVVLVLLLTVVMWVALRPFRRLTQMVSANRNHFGAAAGGVGTVTRGMARMSTRVLTTALGSFLGTAAAGRGRDGQEVSTDGTVPERIEAISSYGPARTTATMTEADLRGVPVSTGTAGTAGPEGMGRIEESSPGDVTPRAPARTARPARMARPTGAAPDAPAIASPNPPSTPARAKERPPADVAREAAALDGQPPVVRERETPERSSPVDLSDWTFEELSEIFRPDGEPELDPRSATPERRAPRGDPRHPRAEAGRGR